MHCIFSCKHLEIWSHTWVHLGISTWLTRVSESQTHYLPLLLSCSTSISTKSITNCYTVDLFSTVNNCMRNPVLFLFWSQIMFCLNIYVAPTSLSCVFGSLLFVWSHEDGVLWLMDRIQDISDRQLLIALKSRAAIRAQQWAHCALGLVTSPPNPNTVAVWDSINFYWGHKCESTMKLCWDEGKETKLAV